MNEITEDADWERFARKYLEIWRRMRLLKNSFYLFFYKHHSSLVRERIFSVLSTMPQRVVLELHNARAGNNCVTADRKNKCIFIPWRTVHLMTAFLPISRPSLYKVKINPWKATYSLHSKGKIIEKSSLTEISGLLLLQYAPSNVAY